MGLSVGLETLLEVIRQVLDGHGEHDGNQNAVNLLTMMDRASVTVNGRQIGESVHGDGVFHLRFRKPANRFLDARGGVIRTLLLNSDAEFGVGQLAEHHRVHGDIRAFQHR